MKLFLLLNALCLLLVGCSQKSYKTTRGPEGSEWGPNSFSTNSNFQIAPQFGALVGSSDEDHSFALGADLDYRPDDLFGFRLSFHQGIDNPRPTFGTLSPLIFTEISNFIPYVYFGPGVSIIKEASLSGSSRNAKFHLASGLGADFLMTDHLGIGLLWQANFTFDAKDFHFIGSRVFFKF